jgi:urea ABC transporter ATP-binding protein UrtE
VLKVEGLEAGYLGSHVLNGFDLELGAGRVLGLLGRNGMGKTTLLRCIMGLLPVNAGAITFEGRAIAGLNPYVIANRGIAYVPQGREIFAELSVEENLRLGRLGKRRLSAEIPEGLFRTFPILAERRGQRAGSLSDGEQQQLAIARALAGEPKLLLLDEPSEGIQPSTILEIAESLKTIVAEGGLTLLLVEQNVMLLRRLAERVLVVEKGRVVADYPVSALDDQELLRQHLAV